MRRIGLLLAVCVGLGLGKVEARSLSSPLDTAGSVFPKAAFSERLCPAVPVPVRDLEAVGYYADPAGSVPDDAKRGQNRDIVKPLDAFTDLVLAQSDRFMATGAPAAAACALDLLHGWAEAEALEGDLSTQGKFHRNWATNALATAYLVIRPASGLDAGKRETVRDWLGRLCRLDQELAERVSNNHLLWSAASCATAGIAAGNGQQLDWAVQTAQRALDEVDEQGVLPREMSRGARALAYHNFALEALVVVAEMAAANGQDLYGYRDGALRRLADLVIRNAGDPSEVAELAGVPQSWSGPGPARFVWAEPYFRRFGDTRLEATLRRLRPLRHAYFGGNATLMYGVALLP